MTDIRALRLALKAAIDTSFGNNLEDVKIPVGIAFQLDDALRDLEPAKPKWIDIEDSLTGDKFKVPQCGACGSFFLSDALYCSQCGKKVDRDA